MTEKDVYILLDFQGKDISKCLKQTSAYFRMLNLNENKPIVEIGEDIYQGTYEDALGTNVYFEEIEYPPVGTNVFEATTPIALKYLLKQTKVLRMNKIGIKSKYVVDSNPMDLVNVEIEDDYRVLLEKFENNTLNIDDYIVDEDENKPQISDNIYLSYNNAEDPANNEEIKEQSPPPEWYAAQSSDISCAEEAAKSKRHADPLLINYAELQKLAQQPSKHKVADEVVDDKKFERFLNTNSQSDFLLWKNFIMQVVERQSVNLDVNKDKIEDFVDIGKSIEMGIITKSSQTYTKDEKRLLLSFNNFVNLSPLMKLIMLQDYVRLEKISMAALTTERLNEKGDDGCTVLERYTLLKNFKDELRSHILLRLQDAQYVSAESFTELEDDDIFNDCRELSDTDFSYSSDNLGSDESSEISEDENVN